MENADALHSFELKTGDAVGVSFNCVALFLGLQGEENDNKQHFVFGDVIGPEPMESAARCYRCKEEGHTVQECPQPEPVREEQLCNLCHQAGHVKQDCPDFVCVTCGVQGHQSRHCPDKPSYCTKCQQEGHHRKDPECPKRSVCKNCDLKHKPVGLHGCEAPCKRCQSVDHPEWRCTKVDLDIISEEQKKAALAAPGDITKIAPEPAEEPTTTAAPTDDSANGTVQDPNTAAAEEKDDGDEVKPQPRPERPDAEAIKAANEKALQNAEQAAEALNGNPEPEETDNAFEYLRRAKYERAREGEVGENVTVNFIDHDHYAHVSISFDITWEDSKNYPGHKLKTNAKAILGPAAMGHARAIKLHTIEACAAPPDLDSENPVPVEESESYKAGLGKLSKITNGAFEPILKECLSHNEDLQAVELDVRLLPLNKVRSSVQGQNLFTEAPIGGDDKVLVELWDDFRKRLRTSSAKIVLIIKSDTFLVGDQLTKMQEKMVPQRSLSPSWLWFVPGAPKDKCPIQKGKMLPPHLRPQYEQALPAILSFSSLTEYVTVWFARATFGLEETAADEGTVEAKLRIVEMKRGNTNVYFASVHGVRGKPDESVRVGFVYNQAADTKWTLKFAHPMPGIPLGDCPGFLCRPYKKDSNTFDQTYLLDEDRIVKLANYNDTAELAYGITEVDPVNVYLTRAVPHKQFERHIAVVSSLYENQGASADMTRVIMGNDLIGLPHYDLVAELKETFGEEKVDWALDLVLKPLSPEQLATFNHLRDAAMRLVLVNGIGGSGKTELIVALACLGYILQDGKPRGVISVMSNTNNAVDSLTNRIAAACEDMYNQLKGTPHEVPEPLVIRNHNFRSEKDESRRELGNQRSKSTKSARQDPLSPAEMEDKVEEQMNIAEVNAQILIYQTYQAIEDRHKRQGHDKRLVLRDHSTAGLVIALAGYERKDGTVHPRAWDREEVPEVAVWRGLNAMWANGEGLTNEQITQWTRAYNALVELLMSMPGVIVVQTPQNFMETRHHKVSVLLHLIDEAAKLHELETVGAWHYGASWVEGMLKCCWTILLGDVQQPKPSVSSPISLGENQVEPFPFQEEVSWFTRLMQLGWKVANMKENWRYEENIGASLSQLGYRGLKIHPSVGQNPEVKRVRELMTRIFKKQSAQHPNLRLIMDYNSVQEKDEQTHSIYNKRNSEIAFSVVFMLEHNGYDLGHVAIQTPYNAELMLMTSMKASAIEAFSRNKKASIHAKAAKWNELTITTVDSLQSGQFNIVILSIPNTAGIGFLEEIARMILAFSRARFGLIIICNLQKLCEFYNNKAKFFDTAFYQVMKWLMSCKDYLDLNQLPKESYDNGWAPPFEVTDMAKRVTYVRANQTAEPLVKVKIEEHELDFTDTFGALNEDSDDEPKSESGEGAAAASENGDDGVDNDNGFEAGGDGNVGEW